MSPTSRRPVAAARPTRRQASLLDARPAAPLATTNGKGRLAARLTERLGYWVDLDQAGLTAQAPELTEILEVA